MPDPLRVLHLIDKNRNTTGSVVQMLAAARCLRERGHQVWVAGPPGGDLETTCSNVDLPFLGLPFRGPLNSASASGLRRHLKNHRIDIVHAHKGRAHSLSLLAATALGRSPRLVVNRGVSFPLDLFNKWKYRHPRVEAVVCVANAVADVVIQTTGINRKKVHTIYGGTDCTVFDPNISSSKSLRHELGLGMDHLVIAQVSVRNWKGWSDLIASFSRISQRFPTTRLLMVGCEPDGEKAKIDEAARNSGLGSRVLTLPYRSDMAEVLAACDIVVDASWAGTGITGTIREAMAMGRAVVATDCGGNRELVIDGEVGLVVPPRNIDALTGALSRLIGDPELRERFGRGARQRVIRDFSIEERIDKLEALYRKILE